MGLRHIQIPTRTVPVGDENIQLRGASFSDLMMLMDAYSGQMTAVFARVLQLAEDERLAGVQAAITQMSKDFPELVGALIALASDDYAPETVEVATKLPFTTQVQCIEAIFDLSFTTEGDIKKFMESVVRMIQAASATLVELQSSPIGIGASDGK